MNDDSNLPQTSWYCPCYDQFRVREWEEESFLFNPASGDTHLLNSLSMEILSLLQQNSLNADALLNRLSDAFASIDSSLNRDHLIEYLRQFEDMGLIVSTQPCD